MHAEFAGRDAKFRQSILQVTRLEAALIAFLVGLALVFAPSLLSKAIGVGLLAHIAITTYYMLRFKVIFYGSLAWLTTLRIERHKLLALWYTVGLIVAFGISILLLM
jgi:hypothetical protein